MRNLLRKFSRGFESMVVIFISALFVVSITYAATTIGSNVTTGGNLTVTGWASSTSATTTAYLDIGVQPDGTTTLVNWTGGDLYVQDDIEVDDDVNIGGDSTLVGTLGVTGLSTFSTVTSTSATTTAYLDIGVQPDGTTTLVNWTGGDLYVQDDIEVDDDVNIGDDLTVVDGISANGITTTDSLVVGGYASTTGDLIVTGGTFDLTTGTATTTPGIFARINNDTATSTLSAGNVEGGGVSTGCLELVGSNGQYYFCSVDVDTPTNGLSCGAGRCNEQ